MATTNGKDYRAEAEAQYDPSYQAKLEALKQQNASQKQALDQSKTGINANFDQQSKLQNLNNTMNKNNMSNAMLGRGLGNSSIAVSGLAGQDATNARYLNDINTARAGALNNVDEQMAMLDRNLASTQGQMAASREDEIRALMNNMEDRDWTKSFQERQQAEAEQMNAWSKQHQEKQLELQKEAQAAQIKYQEAQLKLQEEKQKFDMGYQNRYLEMQQQAQKAEQEYRNASLALQREQAQADAAFKNASLAQADKHFNAQQAWQQQQANQARYDKYGDIYNSIMGMPSGTERDKLMKGLQNFWGSSGLDVPDWLNSYQPYQTSGGYQHPNPTNGGATTPTTSSRPTSAEEMMMTSPSNPWTNIFSPATGAGGTGSIWNQIKQGFDLALKGSNSKFSK